MSENHPDKLTVTVSGKTLFIQVPSDKATALSKFLRSRGIPTSPPSPCCGDTDSIELGKGTNAQTVQTLLDQWK